MSSSRPRSHSTAFTAPGLRHLRELEDPTAGLTSTAEPQSWLPFNPAQVLRSSALLFSAAAGATGAALSFALVFYLFLSHSFTPQQMEYSFPLQLDLSGRSLVSHFSFPASAVGGSKNKLTPPILTPGQRADVWLDLKVPDGGRCGPAGVDLVHIVADLQAADGKSTAHAATPVELRRRGWGLWSLATAPLRWVGIFDDATLVPVLLFSRYEESPTAPLAGFRLTVKPRDDATPDVVAATLRLLPKVNIIQRALYHLRPHLLLAWALGTGATMAGLTGTIVAFVFLRKLVYELMNEGASGEGAAHDFSSEEGGSDSDLLAGVSSEESSPREEGRAAEVGEGETALVAGPLEAGVEAAPPRERPWEKALKQLDELPGGRGLGGPDTAFMGSEGFDKGGGSSAGGARDPQDLRFRGQQGAGD